MTLTQGMDFRLPEHRREVFLRFYAFHLKHRAHPGAVYYVIPFLRERLGWDSEAAYWWAFLNGNTQHPVTTTILWSQFPSLQEASPEKVKAFLDAHWKQLEFDTDRRYWKAKLPVAVAAYVAVLSGRSQAEFFAELTTSADEAANFMTTWDVVRRRFFGFGRLSAWSYLEYLRILGLPIDPGTLFLRDRDGSKSHRNGLCIVLGRDDLDWHDSNPSFAGDYTPEQIRWLEAEALALRDEARARELQPSRDVGFFTLESTLCCYKSWHRPNRRYPNVYNDMFHGRIKRAEAAWAGHAPIDFSLFWQARADALPPYLRLEDSPDDPGLSPVKQNHYRETGQVILMDHEWPCFANDFADRARGRFR